MTQAILGYNLTTKAKVKAFVGIASADTTKDDLLDMLINNVSSWIQSYCNRNFLSQTYTNEMYDSMRNKGTKGGSCLFLNNFPITTFTLLEYRSGTMTSPVWVTYPIESYIPYLNEGFLRFYSVLPEVSLGLRATYTAGYLINFANEGVLSNSTITFTSGSGTATVGGTLTDNTTGATATVVSVSGTTSGTITVTNVSGTFTATNALVATGGWAATCGTITLGNVPLHTLPFDLTMVATEIVARKYQFRQSQGMKSMSVEGESVTFAEDGATTDQLTVLKKYSAPIMAV